MRPNRHDLDCLGALLRKDPTNNMKKQVLFVDDEPNFLSGIKRMLRPFRDEWELQFAGGVDEALAMIKEKEFDTEGRGI